MKWILSEFFIESDMSFVFIDRLNNIKIVYRDFYGKRSLILQSKQSELLISSVNLVQQNEGETDLHTFEMPANSMLVISDASIDLIEFDRKPSQLRFGTADQLSQVTTGLVTKEHRDELKQLMINSVKKRTMSIPFDDENCAVSVMFSGGLDSSLIAAIVS